MENLNFVLFYPVSISVKNSSYKYEISRDMFYPCLIGAMDEDNKCVDIISGKKYDIVDEETDYTEITSDTIVANNPAGICRKIDSSLENLRFIEDYVKAKGRISKNTIRQYPAFKHRLNRLLCIKYDEYARNQKEGYWYPVRSYNHAKHFVKKVEKENLNALSMVSYIQSGEKDADDLLEKNNIIKKLRKRLSK